MIPNVPVTECPPLGSVPGRRAIDPAIADEATVVRHDAYHVDVVIRGVAFCFRCALGRDWIGGCAVVVAAGAEIDERWLTRARTVAAEVLLREIGEPSLAADADPIRCPDCGALFVGPLLAHTSPLARVTCGVPHVFDWRDGRQVTLEPGSVQVTREGLDSAHARDEQVRPDGTEAPE